VLQPIRAISRTPSNSTSRNATIHSALTFSSYTGSTGPVQQRHHRHCRLFLRTAGSKQNHEAPLRAPSPTAAATNHRRQGRQKQRLPKKIINPTTSAPHNLPRHHNYLRHQPRYQHVTTRGSIYVSSHVSGFCHVILHYHITWSEILLPIEYHRSWYAFTLVNQDLALILFFVLAHK
jgi:hypothetical protein